MSYTELDDESVAQLAHATATFRQLTQCESEAAHLRHDMCWVDCKDGPRLHKLDADNASVLKDFGLRTEDLVQLQADYAQRQARARTALQAASQAHRRSVAVNADQGIGRVPNVVIGVLKALARHGLSEHYLVIGTHALYAYEVAARVFFDSPTMSTNDVDLLWDVQKRIKLLQALKTSGYSMIELLQTVDPTFERSEESKESAINAESFTVDFLRQQMPASAAEAVCMTEREGDIYPVQAERAHEFLNSPRFEQVVVGVNGAMSVLRTIDPQTFVDFKIWMSGLPNRDPLKRVRDRKQALAVEYLLRAGKLESKIRKEG